MAVEVGHGAIGAGGSGGTICAEVSAGGSTGIRGATGGGIGAGAAARGDKPASSSAMICRMDDKISSIDGSLVAGLFI